jgi:hypothetical protein
MIPQFLVSNIDAVITTVFGLFFTIYALRKRESLSTSSNRLTRLLPVLAPLVLAFGLIQFFISGNATEPAPAWKIVHTDDGIAQVEFPTMPTRAEATDRAGEMEVHRVSHVADLADGKLNLRLSFNEFPPGSEGLSDADRIAGIREFFVQGGFEIIEDAELRDGVWKLLVAQANNKSRMSMRIAIKSNGIYRALVTSMAGHHDDPRIDRFLNSFAANKRQAEQAGSGQPATRPESKSEGSDKPQPEAEGRSR